MLDIRAEVVHQPSSLGGREGGKRTLMVPTIARRGECEGFLC